MALWSLLSGIASLFAGCCCALLGLPLAVAAVVLGVLSLGKIKREPARYGGTSVAIIGIVLGSISLIGLIVMLVAGFGTILLESMGYRP